MKIAVISFTENGQNHSVHIKEGLKEKHEVMLFTKRKQEEEKLGVEPVFESLEAWTGVQWKKNDAIIFVSACGIAVRAISGFVEDKLKDPAVLVADEMGQFIIPILSGHVGGANELAEEIAEKMGAIPVITTATDLHDIFAVDVFAKKHGLGIANREGIAAVSGSLLKGENVSVVLSPFEGERATLQLCPKTYIVGIGCRRGKTKEEIDALLGQALHRCGIRKEAVAAFASIDRKADEQGILDLAYEYRVPFVTFSAEELSKVEGTFHVSSFVKEQVGIDNVCERAALYAANLKNKGSKKPEIVQEKLAENGVTIALARFEL